ncbi:MAG: Ig-like domain-containing protein [Chitinophagaceae bacterium]
MNNIRRIRFFTGLVLFFLWIGCRQNGKEKVVSIVWDGNKAIQISVPRSLLDTVNEDSVDKQLHTYLTPGNGPAILGEYSITPDAILFKPVIPFTRGLKYKIILGDELISEIQIPGVSAKDAPQVVAIYPTGDTVPENLLKIYIQFSEPMQEGESLQHIVLIKNDRDTAKSVFLDLEPELWNNERTVLTLWLDPGRIKRDLQPNKALGPPLLQGEKYNLIIQPDWRDEEGASLANSFQKQFVVGKRDGLSPDPNHWSMKLPKAGSAEKLEIDLHESLDYILLNSALHIINKDGKEVTGTIKVNTGENGLSFTPTDSWKAGDYTLQIEFRLEDNAGNNLNRLFDQDLTQQKSDDSKTIFKRTFQLQ